MKHRYTVIAFLFVLANLTYIDRICLSLAAVPIQTEMGLSPSQWGWVLGAFALAYALFEIPAGVMGDRIGPRRVLTRIVLWWSVCTSLTSVVRGFWPLCIARFLFGAGEAGAFPNSSATIARWFPVRERGRAQALVFAGSRVGGALAPFIIVPLQQAYGWRMSFIVFGLLGAIWGAAWYTWFRDVPPDPAKVETAVKQAVAVTRLDWGRTLKQSNLWCLALMYHTYSWSGFFFQAWMYTFLAKARGFNMQDLLHLSWVPFLLAAVGSMVGGTVSDTLVKRVGLKWGRRIVGLVGLSASAVFITAALLAPGKLECVVLLGLAYAASDCMLPVSWAVCLDIGGEHVGAVSGFMNTAGQLGSFLTSVAFGYVVIASGSYELPLLGLAVITGLSAVLWVTIDPTRPVCTHLPDEKA